MSVSLKKGGVVSLAKVPGGGINDTDTLCVGLGWDCNNQDPTVNFDLDAWAMVVDSVKGIQRKNLVYFGNTVDSSLAIAHTGDNLTGEGDGDDETIKINLKKVPSTYEKILIGVNIFKGKSRKQTFRNIENCFVRLYNERTGTEICKYEDKFKEEFADCVAMLFGILRRDANRKWEFVAIGEGGKHGSIVDGLTVYKKYELSDIEVKNNVESASTQGTVQKQQNGGKKVMAVSLSKGGKVSLAKVAADAGIAKLSKIYVGLGWDVNRYDGGAAFDLDASAFMLGASGKVRNENDFIFYNNLAGPGIQHMGDERTGGAEGDDEQIKIDLDAIPADIAKVAFSITIDQADVRHQNFGMVENSYVHIVDEATGTELIRYDLGEDFSVENTIVVAELYRNNSEWKFNAVGSGFSGGLAALCANFGIQTV